MKPKKILRKINLLFYYCKKLILDRRGHFYGILFHPTKIITEY